MPSAMQARNNSVTNFNKLLKAECRPLNAEWPQEPLKQRESASICGLLSPDLHPVLTRKAKVKMRVWINHLCDTALEEGNSSC